TRRRRRTRPRCWSRSGGWTWGRHGKGIYFIVSGNIDASSSHNAGGAVVMCSRHQFIWPATIVNNGSSVSIVTVQALVPSSKMILRADHPYNHVIDAISRGDKRRTATAGGPVHIPTAGDRRRISRSNAQSGQDGIAVVIRAQRDIGALFGP